MIDKQFEMENQEQKNNSSSNLTYGQKRVRVYGSFNQRSEVINLKLKFAELIDLVASLKHLDEISANYALQELETSAMYAIKLITTVDGAEKKENYAKI